MRAKDKVYRQCRGCGLDDLNLLPGELRLIVYGELALALTDFGRLSFLYSALRPPGAPPRPKLRFMSPHDTTKLNPYTLFQEKAMLSQHFHEEFHAEAWKSAWSEFSDLDELKLHLDWASDDLKSKVRKINFFISDICRAGRWEPKELEFMKALPSLRLVEISHYGPGGDAHRRILTTLASLPGLKRVEFHDEATRLVEEDETTPRSSQLGRDTLVQRVRFSCRT
jgi:hypothetical protein